jgi:hypothetical protein
MKTRYVLLLALAGASAGAAERLVVTASHALDAARQAETITVPWSEVNKVLPGALLQHLVVRDAAGHSLPYQVTNVAPQAKDPEGKGIAYGELIFQHDFAAGEHSASFTVEKSEAVAPPFPVKAFARYVPERLDDFAWENDRIGHRTYGQALAAPDTQGSGKEVLVTSGLDIWFKRVSYPIVDRWYNKGHDHYHKDEGEGIDMYNVGKSRGCGGTGVWDGKQLYTSHNYKTWKVIANGPVRAIFELSYDSWDAAGRAVSEVKRVTVDAGQQFDLIESTFAFADGAPATVAVGLNKAPADKGQAPQISYAREPGTLLQWVEQAGNGAFGTAIVLPGATGYAEDSLNQLVLASATAGKPLRYYVGAAWTRAGRIASQEAWKAYTATVAARAANPLRVTLASADKAAQ